MATKTKKEDPVLARMFLVSLNGQFITEVRLAKRKAKNKKPLSQMLAKRIGNVIN